MVPAMDLATSHLGTDLDGLAALVAVDLLEGPFVLALPGSFDPVTTRFYRDHGHALAPLLPEPELRARLAAEPLGRLAVVDTNRSDRLGFLKAHLPAFASVTAYDTHGPDDADLPLAPLPPAAATVSPLVLLLAARGLTPTPAQAGLFLLGIHADTGHFVFPGTTAADYQAAAHCAAWGADPAWVDTYVPRGLDRHRLHLVARMAERVELVPHDAHDVALVSLDLDDYEPDLAPLLDTLRRAEGWEAAFLIAADPRRTSVIGRSSGHVDVAAALRPLGGGGHPEAASASLRAWPIPEVRALLKDALTQLASPPCAADLASATVYTVPADAPLDDAAAALHQYKINAIPLTRDGAFVGLVSRREADDAVRHGLGARPAASFSQGPPAWVPPDASIADVRRVMLETPGRLVLVGAPDGDARGVITRTAIFRAAAVDPPLAGTRTPPSRDALRDALARALGPADLRLVADLGALAEPLGLALHLVGGAVRDVLLERPVEDLDLVVVGDAPTLGRAAAAALGGKVHVHDTFGTCTWTTAVGRKVDLTTARTESYRHPAALPDVARGGLFHDLLRRDFTVNAMAIAVTPSRLGELVDPFGGQLDLKSRIIRVLHGLSFHDDPTRAWRAARFAGRFDFTLAPGSQALLREALRAGFVDRLSPARLGAELHKLLGESQVVRSLAMLRDWGLLAPVHPALATDRELLARVGAVREAWARYREIAPGAAPDPGEAEWIALGWDLPTDERRALTGLTARARGRTNRWVGGPVRVRAALDRLARAARDGAPVPGSERALAVIDLEPAERIAAMAFGGPPAHDAVAWWEREGHAIVPALDGHALMAAGVPAGRALGVALAAARAAAWDGADRHAQLAAATASVR